MLQALARLVLVVICTIVMVTTDLKKKKTRKLQQAPRAMQEAELNVPYASTHVNAFCCLVCC
jgi:hypothetical protein